MDTNINNKVIQISSINGLHARPASLIVKKANEYNSDLKVYFNNKIGNLKSIMSIMALNIRDEDTITIEGVGSDSKEAINEISYIFNKIKENEEK